MRNDKGLFRGYGLLDITLSVAIGASKLGTCQLKAVIIQEEQSKTFDTVHQSTEVRTLEFGTKRRSSGDPFFFPVGWGTMLLEDRIRTFFGRSVLIPRSFSSLHLWRGFGLRNIRSDGNDGQRDEISRRVRDRYSSPGRHRRCDTHDVGRAGMMGSRWYLAFASLQTVSLSLHLGNTEPTTRAGPISKKNPVEASQM
jgi:hypothetical protein